jgi:DNA-binding HxlR family transcriptional regulator
MSKAAKPASPVSCPLNRFLELFGDRWTLLIVRDLLFGEKHEFGEFLSAREGIATNVLADRLRRLERLGVVTRRPHPTDARKRVYSLSIKGVELAPVLIEAALWSERHEGVQIPAPLSQSLAADREALLAELRSRVSGREEKPAPPRLRSRRRPV